MMKKSKHNGMSEMIVFRVQVGRKTQEIVASNVQDLKQKLGDIWPAMADYSLQAAAHLAFAEQLPVGNKMMGIWRIGTRPFVPDAPANDKPKKSSSKSIESDKSEGKTTSQTHANDETQNLHVMPEILP
ncbi:hypothetical protein [Deinococcus fonticola]|uniref:hypothetical protein n=1 Tax=Deinococcus fonticola TaxID=2528713 RepID=UPI0010752DCD|nr:hypothetical protein [Deinococcus fonticola]